ncbi:MAG: hypothetical protein EOO77_07440 [Oxalobacteraceae bacterium]|nr:MAG: hypothetical protein EOO77_07440 [Oxalobacteraceae bacterium]
MTDTASSSDVEWPGRPLFSNCGQVGSSTIAPERFNVPAGVTVLFEVDHEGRLIMLSDVVGPKVHFGV